MGAVFGHTYEVYNNHYAALAFSRGDVDRFESEEEYVQAQNDAIAYLKAIKLVEVTFKGLVFDVKVGIESTHNGDDLCLVPSNLWEAYSHRLEYESTNAFAIDWQAVAKHEDALQQAFELALCEAVFQEFPQMLVRQRTLG